MKQDMMKQTIKTFLALLALLVSSTGVWAQKTAYAVLTGDGNNKTLTFKYEVHTVSGSTEWDVSNTGSELPGWTNEKDNITQVVFDPSFDEARPKSCAYWFSNCEELTTITGIGNLNTSQVTNISSMFAFCRSLTKLDLSHFNTSNVIEMDFMFSSCSSLQSLDLSNFDTGNVTNMRGMFWASKNLTSLDVSSFNTEKVTNMRSMFYDCNNLTSLDLSNFDTRNVTDMGYMFSECTNLTSLTIGGGFTVGSSTDVNYMFNNCTNLASGTLKVIGTIVPNIERDIFSGVYTGGTLITDKALNISSGWKGGTFNTVKRMTAYAVLSDNTDGDNTKTLTFKYEVHAISGSNEWDASNTGGDHGYDDPGWYSKRSNITRVVFDPSFADARPKSCAFWFKECANLTTIEGIEYLKTNEVTYMSAMFASCKKLKILDVSKFNTCLVEEMSWMFQCCESLTSLDLTNFDTGKVKEMNAMFDGCSNLQSLDLSNFNTSQVTSMAWIFDDCSSLQSLDLGSFNTSNVTNMRGMFYGCEKLTSLAIGSGFEVKSTTTTTDIFSNCTALANGTLYVKGTSAPSIAQDIFSVFTGGTLITDMTVETLGATVSGDNYIWNGGTFNKLNAKKNVTFLDETGTSANQANVLPISPFSTSLAAGWYYVDGNVTINSQVSLTGNVNLILSDDATLTVNGGANAGISGNYDLTIYGQNDGSGQLIIHSDTDKAIDSHSLSIFGGKVETGCTYGIYSATDVVIDGGVVTATGTDGDGIYAAGDVTINGGQVTATGSDGHYGINAGGIITLGFIAQEDFILANSYNGTVKTAAGKGFSIAGGGTLNGGITLDASQKTAIAGKKLTPVIKAQIGTDYYSSLQGALDVANDNDIIEILSDINEPTTTKTYTGDHNHTFNLNGHSVTFNSYSAMGALTINGSGTLTCNTLHNTNVGNDNTLTIDGATVICNGSTSPAVTPGIEWSADHIVLKGGANVTVYNGLFLGGGDDEFTFTIQDKASIFKMIDCTISGYCSNDVLRNQFLPYVEPGHEAELIVDGTTTNSLTFKKDWGLILVSDLTNATVTFYKAADITTFNTESPGTVATWANAPDYVVMHIVPDAGYWTNQELLFAMETGATLAPSMRAPGLDLGQVPTLLKADEGYSNGAGWYYYQIPAGHSVNDGYITSTIDGFVAPKFDLSTATVDANDAKTYHVSNGDWNTTISIDENSFTYNGAAQGPQLSGTTLQIKKGTNDACTLPLSGNISLSGTETNANTTPYNATLSYVANGCFTDTKAVPFSISKKALTITADDASKVYDGTALTKNSYTHTITATGDVIESVTITGSQTNVGNSNNVPSAAVIKNASDVNVTANYDITYTNGTLTVTKKTVKDDPDANNGEGTVNIVLTDISVDGFTYNGNGQKPTITVKDGTNDNAQVIPTSEYTVTIKDANDNAVDNPTNAGTYTIVITDNADGNYDISGTKTFTINQKALTITADDQEKAAGSDDPTLTYTQDGLVDGDAITGALMRVAGEAVGSYAISQGTLSAGNNYTINFTGATLTIYRDLKMAEMFSGTNEWASMIALEDLAVPAGVAAYIVTGVSGNTVITKEISYIPAGVPIILQKKDNNASGKATAGTGNDDVSDNKLLGNATTATDIQIHKDYVLYNDRFELAGVSSVPAGKAYLPATALSGTSAPSFLHIEGGSTGVALIDNGELIIDNDVWYTLDGRKLDKQPTIKGVYVVNGKKRVVR